MPRSAFPPGIIAAAAAIGTMLAVWAVSALSTPNANSANAMAPPISGTTLDGKAFELSQLKGKVVLVNFWASWCGPCRSEFPDLLELEKKYGPRGFAIVGVAVEEEADRPKSLAVAQQAGLDYPILMARREWLGPFGGVAALPTSALLDREGRILSIIEGVDPEDRPLNKIGRLIEKAL